MIREGSEEKRREKGRKRKEVKGRREGEEKGEGWVKKGMEWKRGGKGM